jgi:hypothetical protein
MERKQISEQVDNMTFGKELVLYETIRVVKELKDEEPFHVSTRIRIDDEDWYWLCKILEERKYPVLLYKIREAFERMRHEIKQRLFKIYFPIYHTVLRKYEKRCPVCGYACYPYIKLYEMTVEYNCGNYECKNQFVRKVHKHYDSWTEMLDAIEEMEAEKT